MKEYLDLLQDVLENGVLKEDRTGTGTLSVFGRTIRFDLTKTKGIFPLLTTKKIHFRSVLYELLWILRGETNIRFLTENGVTIWNEWANKNGDLGPVYGKQWRKWEGANGKTYDQIDWVIKEIKKNPNSRRLLVSAWKVDELDKMALHPCHYSFQFNVSDRYLSLKWSQRSVDTFLGLPFNIASYALLLSMVSQVTNYLPGELIGDLGDTHIYNNHINQVMMQLEREPRPLPTLKINPDIKDIDQFCYEDFSLFGYNPHPSIKAEISV